MKKLVKNKLVRKKEGDQFVEAAFCLLSLLFAMLILILGYSVWMTEYQINDKIDLIETSYLKKMETEGYLTSSDKNNLIAELETAGLSDIDLSGTTFVKTEYGQKIIISISGNIDLSNASVFSNISSTVLTLRNMFNIDDFGKVRINNHSLSGTSKH